MEIEKMETVKITEEENEPNLPTDQQNVDLVAEIVGLIKSIAQIEDYRIIQRKECYNLVRLLKTLMPFLDEVQALGSISHDGIVCLSKLNKTIHLAKKLLKACHEGSKIYMALESEAMMIKFHVVYEKLSQVLDELPFHELEVSKEAREQIELMQTQLGRARRRKHTQDIELALDLMVLSSKADKRNADDLAIIERLAIKLELQTVEDLKIESRALRKLANEKGQTSESIKQTIELLNKFKKVIGMEVTNIFEHPIMAEISEKSESLKIPHEFLCSITLEIMSDPVIVASGQTYERHSIERWFEANHHTCPKTGQTLAHLSLAPNYALKNLIGEWCKKNNFKLPKKDDLGSSQVSFEEHKEQISSLIEELSSVQLDVQRKAVKIIRNLSKENPDTRVQIAENGAIPPLVQLLSYPDLTIQEHAVTALMNLSIHESNKKLISNEEAIPAIIEVLQKGNTKSRENSAAALLSLSMLDENKVVIALENGIPPLVDLLQNGTIRGKRDAATALFSLALNQANKARVIDAGIVPPLLSLLKDTNIGMVDEALSIFLLLASHPEGRYAIGQISFIGTLVDIIKNGTPKNKECATSVLLELGSNNSSHRLVALQFGVYEHLVEISQSGTNRAQRKAKTLLQLISKSEEIP